MIPFIGSKTRASILSVFFNNPEKEYYLRQLERLTGYSAANIRREIIKLNTDGFFEFKTIGKMKLYKIRKDYPLYNEIESILKKTNGNLNNVGSL